MGAAPGFSKGGRAQVPVDYMIPRLPDFGGTGQFLSRADGDDRPDWMRGGRGLFVRLVIIPFQGRVLLFGVLFAGLFRFPEFSLFGLR